jgi:Tol biopolymer transport system component/tRNA A-37 threonylcarbamoyl transferase component Bud32
VIGRSLSHYRITAALGAGGMGEVYRAVDTTLQREVAIKVLPKELARAPERLARFRREAQILASLNHPNIAAIYGLEDAGGTPFLALELVEGEDLKDRLARGAVPADEALEIAEQVAEALEAAHQKGIIHRDLKPANVKISPEGQVKVLDFGLARVWSDEASAGGSDAVSQSPTLTRAGTAVGVMLGTAAYMAPEQARGRPVDKRADVWAFGVLLWEMLTGRSLFGGDTVADVIAAVVTREPDLGALPSDTPRAVRRLLERCLRKDPRVRMPDMGAVRLELQDAITGSPEEAGAGPAPEETASGTRRARERWAWALVVAGLAGALVLSLLTRPDEERRPTVHFTVAPPEGWAPIGWGWPSLSPDGRHLLFAGRALDGSAQTLCLRPLGALVTRPLAGTDGAGMGFWSPDGRSIAFVGGGELRRYFLVDGTVQTICALPAPMSLGLTWGEDGTILFHAGAEKGRIYAVSARGGEPRPVTTVDVERGEVGHAIPQLLPDGRRFLFFVAGESEAVAGTYLASLDDPARRTRIGPDYVRRQYVAGHLLFVRGGTLVAQPFDVERGETTADPFPVAPGVAVWESFPIGAWFSATPDALAYRTGGTTEGDVQLVWLDRQGARIESVGEPGPFGQIALSPDERNVALELRGREEECDIWVMDLARGIRSRVTTAEGCERDPVWSPDGRSLAFTGRAGDVVDLRRKGLRAGDPVAVLTDSEEEDIPEYWSRDGQILLFLRRDPAKDVQSIWALSPNGDDDPERVMSTTFMLDEPQLSPDGRWMAYISDESGQQEVYVEPFRREGERVRISPAGGGQPRWRGDGRELFYLTYDGILMVVEVQEKGNRLEVDLPTALFRLDGGSPLLDEYAVTADGERFLVKMPVQEDQDAEINVILNWTSLARRRGRRGPAPRE